MSLNSRFIASFMTGVVFFGLALGTASHSLLAQDSGQGELERKLQDQNRLKRAQRTEAEQRAAEEGARRAAALRLATGQDDSGKGDDAIPAEEIDAVATGLNPVPEKVVPVWAIHNVTFSPDGSLLVAGLGTGDIHVWSLADRTLKKHAKIHEEWAFATVFDVHGKTIFSAGGDNQIHRWGGPDFVEKTQSYLGHTGDIHALAVTSDNKLLVSAGDDMIPIIWDVDSGKELLRLAEHPRQIPALALSPDGSKLATASRDGKIRMFSVETGELLLTVDGHKADALSVRFNSDGSRLISGGYDGVLSIYDTDMGHQILQTKATEDAIVCVDVSPDGRTVVLVTNEEIIRCVVDGDKVEKDVFKAELSANEQFSFVRFSPDGNKIAASTTGQQILILDEDLKAEAISLRDPEFSTKREPADR